MDLWNGEWGRSKGRKLCRARTTLQWLYQKTCQLLRQAQDQVQHIRHKMFIGAIEAWMWSVSDCAGSCDAAWAYSWLGLRKQSTTVSLQRQYVTKVFDDAVIEALFRWGWRGGQTGQRWKRGPYGRSYGPIDLEYCLACVCLARGTARKIGTELSYAQAALSNGWIWRWLRPFRQRGSSLDSQWRRWQWHNLKETQARWSCR